jgi:hypothetical protein
MGPGDVNRSMDAVLAADEASLLAAREAFAGRWDILEVFGGYMAVPDGAEVVRSSTIGGLTGKLRRMEHEPEPDGDTAYTAGGPRDGRLLDKRYTASWPATAHCTCGEMIRQESADSPWEHTGRKPVEPG